MKRYTHGELPYAKHVIPALYNLMESDESIDETPLPVAASPNHDTAGGDWTGLKKALTTSLTSGTFLNIQLYAVESRPSTGPPKIRPIYFCSAVDGSFTSKLLAGRCLVRIMWSWVCDPSPQARQDSNNGKREPPSNLKTTTTAISMTKNLVKSALQNPTRVQNGSSNSSQSFPMSSVCPVGPSSVRESPTPVDLPLEPALLLGSGAAKT